MRILFPGLLRKYVWLVFKVLLGITDKAKFMDISS